MTQQKTTEAQQDTPIPDGMVEITAQEFDSIYEQVVRPDRAVYLPGYFRRWLNFTGPDMAWMYVAYRQAAYNAGARKGSASSRFSGGAIASLCGASERTYWNRLGNPATWQKLNGLVQIIDTGKEWDQNSATPKRLPRRYTVAMTLPLTPADTASLHKWISGSIESLGGPEAALRAAIVTPLDELIPDNPMPGNGEEKPATVRALVHSLFKGQLDAKLLDSLASAIQNHIMPANDLIVVSLFFLEHILPHLGAGPAWMLTILRDMCYADPKTGESRNRVTVMGGYAEIAGWLGMTRPKTIWEWLNEKYPESHQEAGKYQNAVLQAYVQEVVKDEPQLDFEGQPRTFDVLLEEVPQEIIQMALTKPEGMELAQWRDFQYRNGAIFSIGMARFSVSNGAIFSIAMARFSESVGATCTVLTLKLFKTSSLTLKTTTTESNSEPGNGDPGSAQTQESAAAVVDSDFWELDELFKINNVNANVQKKLREVKATPQAFVAHLLYAFGKQSRAIQHPLNFALKELQSKPITGPDEKFLKLASLPKTVLVALLSGEAIDHPLVPVWRKLMGSEGGKTPRHRELLPILLGDAAPTPEELAERKRSAQRRKTDLQIYLDGLPKPPEETWTCPNCGETWPDDRMACVACGEPRPQNSGGDAV
jgi:hypothetical protein